MILKINDESQTVDQKYRKQTTLTPHASHASVDRNC